MGKSLYKVKGTLPSLTTYDKVVSLPRQARLDAAGVLHHATARGIEQGLIFKDNCDSEDFIRRLAELASKQS